ncbi:43808_t:CDS:2 [Gigaspora margarita]|uniref:43808_t:CDS:1 n=1 Tax=Gigaspora margarita TaxID=4874 RepID=A0ABN7UE97_GIGMA|nr:43808_t:CDS:2 [Gigaspora margarita]
MGKMQKPLNETEKSSEENSAKLALTKKTDKTRNPIAIITDDREDMIKLTQDENLFKKDSILEQILNRLQKIEEKQGVPVPNYS